MKSNGGLEPLVALIKNNENHGNKVEILQLLFASLLLFSDP